MWWQEVWTSLFIRRFLSLLALVLLLAAPAHATSYYFTSAGNDANSCLLAAKCKTLAKFQSKFASALPSDNFLLNKGETFSGGVTLPTHINGSASFRITIGSYGAGAQPVIDGGGAAAACFYARGAGGGGTPLWSYITIDGIECKNTTQYGVVFYQNAGGSLGMPGIVVQNMNIHDTGPAADTNYRNQLMFLDENKKADGVQFLNNIVGACGGHNCIQIQKDIGSPVVSGNYCYGPWNHNCFDLKSVVGAAVTSNICNGAGAFTGACYYTENVEIPASDVTFKFNQAYNNPPNGIEVEWGGAGSGVTTTAHIWNNDLIMGSNSAIVTGGDPSCIHNVTLDVRNNIIDSSSIYFVGHSCPPVSLTWDYNDDGATHTPPLTPRGANDLVGVNPLWFNAAVHDYRLTSLSALINAGLGGLTTNPNMGSELSMGAGTPTPSPTATPTVTATPTASKTPTSTPTPINGPAANSVNMGRGPGKIPAYYNVPTCPYGSAYLGSNVWACAPTATPTP